MRVIRMMRFIFIIVDQEKHLASCECWSQQVLPSMLTYSSVISSCEKGQGSQKQLTTAGFRDLQFRNR